MVFGHNLQHMAPFGVPTTVFCMVFRHATLVFSTPGAIFGTPIPDLDPGWAGDLFCPKMGPGKRWGCGRNGPPWGCTGFCKRGMDCMVPRRPLGKAVSPQTPLDNHLAHFPGFRDPWPSMVDPYCPFVGQWALLSSVLALGMARLGYDVAWLGCGALPWLCMA